MWFFLHSNISCSDSFEVAAVYLSCTHATVNQTEEVLKTFCLSGSIGSTDLCVPPWLGWLRNIRSILLCILRWMVNVLHSCPLLFPFWKTVAKLCNLDIIWVRITDRISCIDHNTIMLCEQFPRIIHATKLQLYMYNCRNAFHNWSRKGDTYLLQALAQLTAVTSDWPQNGKKAWLYKHHLFKAVCVGACCLIMGGTNVCTHIHTYTHTLIRHLLDTHLQQSNVFCLTHNIDSKYNDLVCAENQSHCVIIQPASYHI